MPVELQRWPQVVERLPDVGGVEVPLRVDGEVDVDIFAGSLPPDVLEPLVPDGGGQPKGLCIDEQVQWQLAQEHPISLDRYVMDTDLAEALKYEVVNTAEQVDAFRFSLITHWRNRAGQLREAQRQWAACAHPHHHLLVRQIHGPLVEEMCAAAGFQDDSLVAGLQRGFPIRRSPSEVQ